MLVGDGALAGVEVVAAGVGGELAGVDLDDLRDDAVHELAVVRGHEDGARVAAEELLEPDDRLEVEVVRRLVEEHHVGPHEQDAGQRDAHLPAARERAHVAVHHGGVEAEAGQDLAGARLEGVAAQLVEARLHVPEAIDERLHLVGALGVGERVLEVAELGGDGRDGPGAVHRLRHGAPAGHLAHVLREVADGHAAVDGDLPLVRLLLARDEAEQRGLAGAVRADQPHLLPVVQGGRGLQEQDLLPVLLRYGVEADQGRAS